MAPGLLGESVSYITSPSVPQTSSNLSCRKTSFRQLPPIS